MFYNLRYYSLIAILIALAFIPGCSKEKATTPTTNHPPAIPSNPLPAHQTTGIDTGVLLLCWHCSDPDNDTLKYDVYFDTLSSPVLVASNLLDTSYQVDNIEASREYYWKIIAKDEHGSEAASPVWNFGTIPGQEQIVFASQGNESVQMMMMNTDGSNAHNIGESSGLGGNPSLSYDGSKIAFGRGTGGMFSYIWTMDCNGNNQFQVNHEDLEAFCPVLSPDCSKIAFLVTEGSVMPSAIYVVEATGGIANRITDFTVGAESWKLSWSPDGARIAFDDGTICTINADGTGFQRLTNDSSYSCDPAWSHDGTRIAFSRHLTVDYQEIYQIFAMDADGSNQHNISNSMAYDREPCWSPDDSKIAFSSNRDGHESMQIYVMNADGSDQHRISDGQHRAWGPTWGPWHR